MLIVALVVWWGRAFGCGPIFVSLWAVMPEAHASRQLAEVAARLKAAGERDLRLQLMRGLRAGAAPLIPGVKNAARMTLPKRGGLNKWVADQPVKVSVRTGARTAGVRLYMTKTDAKETNAGYVRHPVFGRVRKDGKRVWAKDDQKIPNAEGWWSHTLASTSPIVTPELLRVLEETAAFIQERL